MTYTIEQMREKARRRLPRAIFDYLDGGAGSERGIARNRAALDGLVFSPRSLVDVSRRDLSITLFGERLPLPFIIAPTGLNGVLRGNGDVLLARVAARNGIPFVLSTASTSTIEDVADNAGGNLWFQLYVMDRDFADMLVERADKAGYRTLVLTVDVPVGGRRPRDQRNGFAVPFKPSPRFLADCLMHPAWTLDQLRFGLPNLANVKTAGAGDIGKQATLLNRQMDASFDWAALERLRERWPHRLLVKGVLRLDDAERCGRIGVDGVILSNHGGRQLEDAPSPVQLLGAGRPPTGTLLVDSGIRSGADIAKALALGADAVMIGRAILYGLAAGGQDGVQQVIDILKAEFDNTLALVGCADAAALDRSCLVSAASPITPDAS